MSDKKIVSWDELESVEGVFTKDILCPKLTEKLGQEIYVKVRPIGRMEFLKAINFPMAEMDSLVAEGAEPERFVSEVQEHAKALDTQGLLDTMENTVREGLVDPDPADGNMEKLSADYETIFQAIVDLTLPAKAVEQGARFREDGEQRSN